MIIDHQLVFCDNDDLSLDGASKIATNHINLKHVRDVGGGQPMFLHVQIGTGMLAGTSAQFRLLAVADDDVDDGANGVVLADSGAIARATLVAGYKVPTLGAIAPGPYASGKKNLVVQATVVGDNDANAGGTKTTDGSFTAWLSHEQPTYQD